MPPENYCESYQKTARKRLNQRLLRFCPLAREMDCDCDADIKQTREIGPWGQPIPDFEPYTLAGDFRGNGCMMHLPRLFRRFYLFQLYDDTTILGLISENNVAIHVAVGNLRMRVAVSCGTEFGRRDALI